MNGKRTGPPEGGKNAPSAWIPERPDRRGAAPAKLSEVLVGAEDFMAKRSGAAIPRAEWTTIVGSRIAARTRVGKIWKGVLTIKVASSSWSNELSFLKPDLIRKLQRAGHDVVDLRFSVDKIQSNSPHPRRGPRSAPSTFPQEPALPEELLRRLEKVDDPNLRAAIAEAAKASFRRR
jgi:hypothetical protein